MNREWVEARKLQYVEKAKAKRDEIHHMIDSNPVLTDSDKAILKEILDKESGKYCSAFRLSAFIALLDNHPDYDSEGWRDFDESKFLSSLGAEEYNDLLYTATSGFADRYLDSDPKEFDGDVIITDPCYVMRHEDGRITQLTEDDWGACDCGENMEVLGFTNYMTRDTLYGDWGCTTYDMDTKQPIGRFCADAGLVSVFLLKEVLEYNPMYRDYKDPEDYSVTCIKDFKGTVQFVVEHQEGVYEDTTDYHKAGQTWEDFSVHVVGHGINKKTGKPINFYTSQTSL